MSAPSVKDAHHLGQYGGASYDENERAAFEAYMAGHCWAICATWRDGAYRSDSEVNGYVCPHAMQTRMLWAVWRDRAHLQWVMGRKKENELPA